MSQTIVASVMTTPPITVPAQATVDAYLPPYAPEHRLDTARPESWGNVVSAEMFCRHRQELEAAMAQALDAALAEYVACQQSLFERPEGHANLGTLWIEQGRTAEAEAELRAAIRRDPTFVPAYVNLADVLRDPFPAARELERRGVAALRVVLVGVPGLGLEDHRDHRGGAEPAREPRHRRAGCRWARARAP